MVLNGQLLVSKLFLKSIKNQLTSADFGLEFGILVKIKHMAHVFHLILGLEFEFEGKNNNFIKNISLCQTFGI